MSQDLEQPPAVLVIVVTYNSGLHIERLLASLPSALGETSAEIVVVDNGSTDDTRDRVGLFGGIHLLAGENVGYAAAINRAVRIFPEARAVLVINPDCELTPHLVPKLRAHLVSGRTGIVVPRIVDENGTLVHSLRREQTLLRAAGLNMTAWPLVSEYYGRDSDYAACRVVDWAMGAVMLFRRELWLALGGWDESFFLYSEETDFCLRAKDAGWSTRYAPDATAMHVGGGSGRSEWTHTLQILNRVRLYSRRHGKVQSMAYWLLTVASECLWWARGRHSSRVAVKALLRPASRPGILGLGSVIVPR